MSDIKPGIYENIPFVEYLAWPFLSNSSLQAARRSLRAYKRRQQVEETPAMKLGTLCHAGKLEPSKVFRNYIVMPDLSKDILRTDGTPYDKPQATKEYRVRAAEFQNRNSDKIIVEQDEFDTLLEMLSQLDRHPLAREWFSADGPTECSMVWDDPRTGLRCKGRLDKLCTKLELICDLKTTADCRKFPKTIYERGYHWQAAMYLDGMKVLTGKDLRYGIVAQENNEPYGVMAAPLSESAIEIGRDEYGEAIVNVACAMERNEWTDYASPDEWRIPAWAATDKPIELTFNGELLAI